MKIIIHRALVCDPQSSFNGKKCDISIRDGVIESVKIAGKSAPAKTAQTKLIDAKGACIAPGFVDLRANVGEPGYEFKETLISAANAAAAGGFTSIASLPDTKPVTQTKGDIRFIIQQSQKLPVQILPLGAISLNTSGKELNELFDMHQSGAVGFTDANQPIMDAGLFLRALQYVKIFDGCLFVHAQDINIAMQNGVSEGKVSTYMGMKGIPHFAEELMVSRDIEIAKYVNAPIHFSHISTKGSVDLIKKAKKTGLQVTCDVAVANLIWTDEQLASYDVNFKLSPPLRTKTDQTALWNGLMDGTIDCIVSDHRPEDLEHKQVEFEYAATGMIQLQTLYTLLNMHAPKEYTLSHMINHLCVHPRKILKQASVSIASGCNAELTLFDPLREWEYNASTNLSLSQNSPLLNQTLKGKVIATFNKNHFYTH